MTTADLALLDTQARKITQLERQLADALARAAHHRDHAQAVGVLLAESREYAAELEARLEEVRAALPCGCSPLNHACGWGLDLCVREIVRERDEARRLLVGSEVSDE